MFSTLSAAVMTFKRLSPVKCCTFLMQLTIITVRITIIAYMQFRSKKVKGPSHRPDLFDFSAIM